MSQLTGTRIRHLRLKYNETQDQLAHFIGISRRALHNYEHGLREPSASVLLAISCHFNISSDYLLGLSDDPVPGISNNLI